MSKEVDDDSYSYGYDAGFDDGQQEGYNKGWEDCLAEYEPIIARLKMESEVLKARVNVLARRMEP
jgi:hypothetical protein